MISYIIPAFNSAKTIEECIHSILIQKGDKELIIVDNGSADNTVKIINHLAEEHPEIKVLEEKKRGPASARNRGLEIAHGDYIAFVDSDVILPEGWAEKAVEILESRENLAGVGGPAKNTSRGIIAELFDPLFLYYMNRPEEHVISLATMNALFKGSIIKNERFDENFVTSEDPELSFRLRRKGYQLLLSRELEVWHHHPMGLKDIFRRWFYYGTNYHRPYVRYPENISPLFLFKIAYLPVFIVFIALGYYDKWLLLFPALMILGVLAMYSYIGFKRIDKMHIKILFPILHTIKFHIHSLGTLYGLIYYGIIRRITGHRKD